MENIKIYNNVKLGKNVIIEDYCIIGKPPMNFSDGELETIIGDNAIIRSHTIIYAGNIIGYNFQTGHHVVIRENNKIGNQVSIGTLSCIEHHIIIEDEVRCHSQVFIPEFTIIKKNAWIGPNVVITNAKYPQSKNVKKNLKGAIIEQNAIIGANVTILPGLLIGKHTLIGCGSVVTNDVDDFNVVVGNPAKNIKKISDIEEYKL